MFNPEAFLPVYIFVCYFSHYVLQLGLLFFLNHSLEARIQLNQCFLYARDWSKLCKNYLIVPLQQLSFPVQRWTKLGFEPVSLTPPTHLSSVFYCLIPSCSTVPFLMNTTPSPQSGTSVMTLLVLPNFLLLRLSNDCHACLQISVSLISAFSTWSL